MAMGLAGQDGPRRLLLRLLSPLFLSSQAFSSRPQIFIAKKSKFCRRNFIRDFETNGIPYRLTYLYWLNLKLKDNVALGRGRT